MNLKYFVTASVLVGGLVLFAFSRGSSITPNKAGELTPIVETPAAWIEVVSSSVYELDQEGKAVRTLASGDEILAPVIISTNASGQAVVHFADGSVLRLDKATKITLTEGDFSAKTGTLSVRVTLGVGKVWSKIVELATPESVWEVETSDAVATVRGTAFGMEANARGSKVIGSQNSVAVTLIDPKTKERRSDKKVEVAEDGLVEILSKDVPTIIADKKEFRAATIPIALRSDTWIKNNQEGDRAIETKIEQLRESGIEKLEIRRELQKGVGERFETVKQLRDERGPGMDESFAPDRDVEVRIDTRGTLPIRSQEEKSNVPIKSTVSQDSPLSPITPPSGTIAPPKALEIVTKMTLSGIQEGGKIPFRAILRLADGGTKDVTTLAQWGSAGHAGFIAEPGVFVADIEPEYKEFGEVMAVVFAIFKDPVSGIELQGRTPQFPVRLFFIDDGARAI